MTFALLIPDICYIYALFHIKIRAENALHEVIVFVENKAMRIGGICHVPHGLWASRVC